MTRYVLLLLFAASAFLVFSHLDDHQLEFYDEARRGVNALEMARGDSHWLIPTFAGESDNWGTKPPLLVWTQALFIRLIGINELAVRLPAALASMALFGLLAWWAARDWGGPLAGGLAALIVFTNQDYAITHGARSGDYDALLILFLTAQMVFFYRWVRSGRYRYLLAAGLAILLAGWTKGVAGCFFLPGIGLWFLLDGDARKKLLDPRLYAVGLVALGGIVAYYFGREAQEPGFLQILMNNELAGRFSQTNEGHAEPWYFYLGNLFGLRSPGQGTFTLFALLGFLLARQSARSAAPHALVLIVLLTFLTVISAAATKLYWYAGPALPPIALLAAYALIAIANVLSKRFNSLTGAALIAAVMTVPVANATEIVLNPKRYTITPYGEVPFRDFMRSWRAEPPYTVLAREYNPNALFYVEQFRSRGEAVKLGYARATTHPGSRVRAQSARFDVDDRVMVCHTETWDYVFKRYRIKEIEAQAPCKLVRVVGKRSDIE